MCGKICSGKSYYAKKLNEKLNAVMFSPDEATYELIGNEQGGFYDAFIRRLLSYMDKKAVETVRAGADVIYERGLWSKAERDACREYFKEMNADTELHYVHVSDEIWKKQIEERNKRCLLGKAGSDFYLDEGLMQKLLSQFQEPLPREVDVWVENDYGL